MNKKLREILSYFGIENQKKQTIEELAELIRAISKEDVRNITEEIADVEIMLEQLKMIYWIDNEEIEKIKEEKMAKVLFKIKQS